MNSITPKLTKIYLLLALLLSSFYSFSQLKVGSNPTQIQKSSLLELESDRQGLLLPRLTDTASINALVPPDGMLIYLTPTSGTGRGLYIRKSGVWQRVTTDSASLDKWSKTGDNLLGSEKLGSLNAQTLRLITNNLNRLTIDGTTGNVAITNSETVGGSLTVADTTSTRRLIVTDSVRFNSLNRNTNLTEILVIDTSNGSVQRRSVATDAFKNWVIGSFSSTINTNGLSRVTGATTDSLILHAASATTPGGVSINTQSFAGNKTFVDSIAATKTALIGSSGSANSTLQVQGSVSLSIRTITSSTTLTNTDYTILADATAAAITIILPTPSSAINGRTYIVKKIAGGLTNDVILSGPIEDGTSLSIYNDWTVVKLQTNGSKWYIIR